MAIPATPQPPVNELPVRDGLQTRAWSQYHQKMSDAIGGMRTGTVLGDDAMAGQVGEYISATTLIGAAVPLTTVTTYGVVSIDLSAGDWDVWSTIGITTGGATITNAITAAINAGSPVIPTPPDSGGFVTMKCPGGAGGAWLLPVGAIRINLTTPTTVYLSASSDFSAGTSAAYGFIGARRMR